MRRGFTLVEIMIVAALFTIIFAALLVTLTNLDRSWRQGQNKLIEQQEARKAMDNMAPLLRQSNPNWVIDGTNYPVTITGGNRIDFYRPIFDANGDITMLRKVTYKLNPNNPEQLLMKDGTAAEVVVANEVQGLIFGGGCAGCAIFNCDTVADDCPVVTIDIATQRETLFNLSSQVTLRNNTVNLSDDVGVEEPEEGEF